MIKKFYNYKVKIKDIPFKTTQGTILENTVTISFQDKNKKEITYVELGFISKNRIFDLIDKGENINLDNCYIENFSLSDYRTSRELSKNTIIKLHGFSAYEAFFDSRIETDFSNSEFDIDYKNFEGAHFINGSVSFHNANFNHGGINFSYVVFYNGNVDFSNIAFGNGEINFKNSFFGSGEKNFKYAHFGEGQTLFVNTEFNDGDVSFVNTEFEKGKISFKVARFGNGEINFHFARFKSGNISFERTEFGKGKVDFRATEFSKGKINFNRATFGKGEKTFEACQLQEGRLSFKKADFGIGDVTFDLCDMAKATLYLDKAKFGNGNLSFSKANIAKLSLKSCHLDYYVDLRLANCNFINLSDVIGRDIIDIKPSDFSINIKTLNLSGMRLIGRFYIDWYENNVKNLICSQTNTNNREKSEQFRILKENFNFTGQYIDEDMAYVDFKRYEMKADIEKNKQNKFVKRILTYPSFAFRWLVFDKIGLYATNPVRVLISMIFSYIFFSLLYSILPYIANTNITSSLGDPDKLSSVSVAFYHSAVTFLTIGYGDYYPSGVIRFLSGIEGFIGLFLMSYFTVAFVRKILR
ncbi:MAG: potassium channel family protein [Bacteroidota bacterium]|nr:potassium channel family protein [Bacteroidota bacterium]